jgi:DNA-binding NarL/FixJ family response regulator
MNLLIADDHPLFRLGLKSSLERAGLTVVGEAAEGEAAVRLVRSLKPDAVLLDIRMPVMDGITAARVLRENGYRGVIVILTTFTEPALQHQAAEAGVDAFLSKEAGALELAERLHNLVNGPRKKFIPPSLPAITPREQEVLQLLAQGLTAKEIGRALDLSPETVRDHMKRIYLKLDASNRVEALSQARKLGMI